MKTLYLLLALVCPIGLLAQVQVFEIAPMNEFRSGHGAAMLEPGFVLAAGGWDGAFVTPTAEVYDYSNDSWDLVINMAQPRTDYVLVSIGDGQAIAAGGWDGMVTNHASTEIFDLTNGAWTNGPQLAVGRANLRATTLLDGRILFTGGFDGIQEVSTADLYDPQTNTITQVADMLYARSSHEAMALPDGRVLVAGGFNPNHGFQMNQCEIYDPETNMWTEVAPLNFARDNFASLPGTDVGLVIGGRFFDADLNLFTGIETAERYDLQNDTWNIITLPTGHCYNLAFGLMNGSYYSVGGADHTGFEVDITYSDDIEMVWGFADLLAFSLEDLANANTPRYRGAACEIFPYDGTLSVEFSSAWLVCGGDENNVGQAEIWGVPSMSVEQHSKATVGVFPNPVSDRCIITGITQPKWTLYNAVGQRVGEGEGDLVEVFGLTAGCYTLHAMNSTHVGVTRFFVTQ